jgi:hypothetical protein
MESSILPDSQRQSGHCRATLLSLSGVLFTGLLLVAIGGERPPWRYVALRAALHAATADVGDPLQECPSVGPLPTAPHILLWWTPPDDLQLTPAESRNWVLREAFASVRRHAGDVPVVTVSAAMTRGPHAPVPLLRYPLPTYFDALPINHQGDFGSIALLAEHGGAYLDTDLLVLRDLAAYMSLLNTYAFVGFGGNREGDEAVQHGVMLSRPGSTYAVRGYEYALRVYEGKGGCKPGMRHCASASSLE